MSVETFLREAGLSSILPASSAAVTSTHQAVPVFVTVDLSGASTSIKESFTWRLDDSSLNTTVASSKLCQEVNLPPGYERQVEAQLQGQLATFKGWKGLGAECRQVLKIRAQVGDRVFTDCIEWDLNQPHNTPERYASTVCADLGLGWEFVAAISKATRAQVAQAWQVVQQGRQTTMPPLDKVKRGGADVLEWGPYVTVVKTDADMAGRALLKAETESIAQQAKKLKTEQSSSANIPTPVVGKSTAKSDTQPQLMRDAPREPVVTPPAAAATEHV